MAQDKNLVMVTVSGADRPGITAAFTAIFLEHGAQVVDIEQASLQDLLGLYFLLDLGPASDGGDSLLKDLLFAANQMGLTLNFRLYTADEITAVSQRNLYVLTHFGGTGGLAALSRILGELGVNIERIATMDHSGDLAMELTLNVRGADLAKLKEGLMVQSRELGFDLALQKMEAYRKNKRMVFFDMDSTLVDMEVIDEMARAHGVYSAVARITEKAMRGEFGFEESLRQRVALLKGLPLEAMQEIREGMLLSPEVAEVIATLKWLGYKLGVVTGGFDYFAEDLKQRLGLDYAFANRLELKDGKLTGQVLGEVVDAAAKARRVNEVAAQEGVLLDQVVVVGDGANDDLMLGQAGLGIAYNAKPRLQEVADGAVGRASMTNILHLLGITEEDIAQATARST